MENGKYIISISSLNFEIVRGAVLWIDEHKFESLNTYLVWTIHFIGVGYSKTVILIQDYRLDINVLLPIFSGESL